MFAFFTRSSDGTHRGSISFPLYETLNSGFSDQSFGYLWPTSSPNFFFSSASPLRLYSARGCLGILRFKMDSDRSLRPISLFHHGAQIQQPIDVDARLDAHLVKHDNEVLDALKADHVGIAIVVRAGAAHRDPVQEVRRLSAQTTQRSLENLNPGLQGSKAIGRSPPAGDVKMRNVQLGIGECFHDHGIVLVDLIGRSAPVMVRMLDVCRSDLQPPLGEFHRSLKFSRTRKWGTPRSWTRCRSS